MLELKPFLSERVWGGDALKKLKNISMESFPSPLGETWEVSTHKEGTSSVLLKNGEIKSLKEYLKNDLSYLVKFISCEESLSIQVHPGDEYAKVYENSRGKTECWMILEAEAGAGLYLGFKPGITREIFQKMIDEKLDASSALNFYPVKPGDFFFVPHGSIHALGKGITLVEIQQSSGVTYRVWDWNRVGLDGKPRELHVKKSFDVLNFEPEKNSIDFFKHTKNIFNKNHPSLVQHSDFKVALYSLKKGESLTLVGLKNTSSIVILDGQFRIGEIVAAKYSTYLCDSSSELAFTALTDGNFLIVSE